MVNTVTELSLQYGKFSEFDPTRPKDVAWVNQDLTTESEYKNWEDFKDEPVENLSDIVM